jgi:NAD dependent epimerase/dehydratase
VRYSSRGDRGLLELLSPDELGAVDVRFGDLRDADTVRRVAEGVETVFHLGALIAIPYSYVSPRDVVDTNVGGTLNVLEAARAHGVRRVLQTSTSEVYGTAQYVPIDERHPLQGQSPYAASKIGADQIAESFHRSFDVPVSIVRPFNTYGPRQSARAIIPTIVSQALTGDTLRLGSLTPTRDLLFVEDTAAGFCAVAESEAALGQTINLGTGQATSIGDLVEAVGRLLGRRLDVQTDEQRVRPARSEVMRLLADASLARRLTGWEPRVSLDEGLGRVVEWMRGNLARYRPEVYAV